MLTLGKHHFDAYVNSHLQSNIIVIYTTGITQMTHMQSNSYCRLCGKHRGNKFLLYHYFQHSKQMNGNDKTEKGLIKRSKVRMEERYLDLFRGPLVQVDRLDSGYVHSQVPVDAGAPDADKNSQIPRSPSWT